MAKKTVKKAHKPTPRTFNIVAKRVHKYSKKHNLNWSWQEAQKFTSKNVFKTFKGIPKSKLKVTEIDLLVNTVLQTGATPPTMPTRAKEVCDSVFDIPSADLEPVNWWDFPDKVESFPPMVNIAIEFGSILSTGITKRNLLPNLLNVREDFRKLSMSSGIAIVFKILVRPKRKDDGKPCSYYILATIEGSDFDSSTEGNEIDVFVSEQDLPEEVRAKRKQLREEKAKKVTKKEIKAKPRPQQVEAKPVSEEKITLEAEKYKQLNIALDGLREDFKLGILTKKQYLARQAIILSKFEKGGKI